MTRTGKIARLPRTVRDTLNRRLHDGEPGPRLVAWLNQQPETKAVAAELFGGREITVQNLSDWRQGGYGDWCRQQDALALAGQYREDAEDLSALGGGWPLTDRYVPLAAIALIGQLRAVGAMEEGPEKVRATLAVVTGLVRLRSSDRQWERADREWERHERAVAETDRASVLAVAQEKARGQELLASYSGDLRRYYLAVRAALAENRVVPAPVLEFLAGEAEFEHRHAAALRELDRYREPPYEDFLRNRRPGDDWGPQVAAEPPPAAAPAPLPVAPVASVVPFPVPAPAGSGAAQPPVAEAAKAQAPAETASAEPASSAAEPATHSPSTAPAAASEANPAPSEQTPPAEKQPEEEAVVMWDNGCGCYRTMMIKRTAP
ncbi:MAG: hypothetical protein NTV51_25525 [Verrucomicrobia bacterium]|nr:hypothetical protein [Verrucomicrobiota bacterium]